MSTVATGSWLSELKNEARAAFTRLGFPTTAMEEWQFTPLGALAKTAFAPAPATVPGLTRAALDPLTFPGAGTLRIVAVNGRLNRELSDAVPAEWLKQGVRLMSLAEALEKHVEDIRPHLGAHAKSDDHAFRALNTAEMTDGFYLHVPANVVLEMPIHLLHVGTSLDGAPAASHPRTLLVLERGAQATVVEGFLGYGVSPGDPGVYFTNSVSEVVLAENAVLDHYRLQEESLQAYHVSSLYAHQAANSNFFTHAFTLGGALSRNDAGTVLDGEGCEGTLNGLYVIAGEQLVDNHTMIDHAKPHCHSFEVYKGILDGRSRGVFNGRILVRIDAQKTDSKQTNKNLLLSNEALVNTNPQLEIYADDVKCTHGATIGQLDAEQIFYLRSRGIGHQAARWMLTYAFANDLVQRIKVPALRERLDNLFVKRLGHAS